MYPDAQTALRLSAHGLLALICLFFLSMPAVLISGLTSPPLRPPVPGPKTANFSAERFKPPPTRSWSKPIKSTPARIIYPPAWQGNRQHQALAAGAGPRLAIVIDDIGHNLHVVRNLLALNRPLTFAVLPMLPNSKEAATLIRRAGLEIIVHLPMEPYRFPQKDPGPLPLLLSLSLSETAFRVREYLDSLPEAIGASNHMGSAFTHNSSRMEVVQTILAERRLFFLNSRTSGATAPWEVARRWGYPYLERDVFLDHDPDERAVEAALNQVVRQARRHGRAIAIGHPYPQTLGVLRRRLPTLGRKGVTLVPLSRMLTP